MPMAFKSPVVVTNENRLIALSAIESVRCSTDEEDQLIDKLKDDLTVEIITLSGAKYDLSIRYQMKIFDHRIEPNDVLWARESIIEKWFRILGS